MVVSNREISAIDEDTIWLLAYKLSGRSQKFCFEKGAS